MNAILAEVEHCADDQILLLRKLRFAFGFSVSEARDFVRLFGETDAARAVDNAGDSRGTHDEG